MEESVKNIFSINANWISAEHGNAAVRQTSAFLKIAFETHVATTAYDDWSKSVQDSVRLSAYPLALWFASSWWRLRWEPFPARKFLSWRMAHETPAAGFGYLWPNILFHSDGESILAISCASESNSPEPVRYLNSFHVRFPVRFFEGTIDKFNELVLSRLNAVGLKDTALHSIWSSVLKERNNPEAAKYRRLEACLGFDADEASEELIESWLHLEPMMGSAALFEVAPAFADGESRQRPDQLQELVDSVGAEASIEQSDEVNNFLKKVSYQAARPWERGWSLAQCVRGILNIPAGPLSDKMLADCLHMSTIGLTNSTAPRNLSLGVAVRQNKPESLKILFRRHQRTGRRFEAARFLADQLLAPAEDHWLPTTDARTLRQQIQRAFAAEFLCPIGELRDYLQEDFSPDTTDDAADYFGVSSQAVRSLLANHRLIPSETILLDLDNVSTAA